MVTFTYFNVLVFGPWVTRVPSVCTSGAYIVICIHAHEFDFAYVRRIHISYQPPSYPVYLFLWLKITVYARKRSPGGLEKRHFSLFFTRTPYNYIYIYYSIYQTLFIPRLPNSIDENLYIICVHNRTQRPWIKR